MPLPLPVEIVGTDRSLGDNEGAVRELGVVGGLQKTRAVVSLETRMRVVASIEVLTCCFFNLHLPLVILDKMMRCAQVGNLSEITMSENMLA